MPLKNQKQEVFVKTTWIIETLPIQPLKPFNLEKSQYLKVGRENIERCPLQKLTVHSVREKSDVAAGNLNLLKR